MCSGKDRGEPAFDVRINVSSRNRQETTVLSYFTAKHRALPGSARLWRWLQCPVLLERDEQTITTPAPSHYVILSDPAEGGGAKNLSFEINPAHGWTEILGRVAPQNDTLDGCRGSANVRPFSVRLSYHQKNLMCWCGFAESMFVRNRHNVT
jgi:hypothetical protein